MNEQKTAGFCNNCKKEVLIVRPGTNHVLHLILSIITFGLWIPVWIWVSIKIGGWRCSQCGSKAQTLASKKTAEGLREAAAPLERVSDEIGVNLQKKRGIRALLPVIMLVIALIMVLASGGDDDIFSIGLILMVVALPWFFRTYLPSRSRWLTIGGGLLLAIVLYLFFAAMFVSLYRV